MAEEMREAAGEDEQVITKPKNERPKSKKC